MRLWLCICFLVITGFGSQVMAESPFDGTWSAHVVRQVGAQDLTIVLTSDDAGRVTGSLAGQSETELQIVWGFVKGDLIVFKVDVSLANEVLRRLGVAPDRPLPFVYVGKIEGEQIAFGRRPEDLSVGCGWRITTQPRNPVSVSSFVILGEAARMCRCATCSSCSST